MNLLKTVATVSGLTLLSRVTGLIREVLTASLFGAGAQTDAFFVAFRLPNLLRRLFAEGAFTQAFVPVLGQVKAQQGEEAAKSLAGRAALLLFLVLAVLVVLAILAAPLLVWLMTGGFSGDTARFDLATEMTRWMFPYILLISMVALAAGVLNTFSEFRLPAFTPVLLNLSFIGAALLLAPRLQEPIWALVVAVLVGGLAQLLLQFWGLRRLGLLRGWSSSWLRPWTGLRSATQDPHVKRMLTLMLPASLAVSVAQVSLVINTHIASRLEEGSVSWLTYADRLMEFPTALLGVALGTVLLPSLTQSHNEGNPQRTSELIDWGLRLLVLLSIPAAVALAFMSVPLTAGLFHYGAFDAQDLEMTAMAMSAYSVGLLGLIAVKVLAPGFYAQQNIKTPVKAALFTLVLTQLLNLATVPLFQHAGLALSTSLAACANALLLYWQLRRRGHYNPLPGWTWFWPKVLIAGLAMAALTHWMVGQYDWVSGQTAPMERLAALAAVMLLASASYLALLSLFRVKWLGFLRPPAP